MIIDSEEIYNAASELIIECGTRNPFKIASELGIYIDYVSGFDNLLGMYTVVNGERHILLNNSMSAVMGNIVCAHELGHDSLHKELVGEGKVIYEKNFGYVKDKTEYEANAFASHILIDENDILSFMENDRNITEIAARLNTETSLLVIKLNEMKNLGYHINITDESDSKFLADTGADSMGVGDGFSDGI